MSKFTFKDKLDAVVYKGFNLFSDIYYFFKRSSLDFVANNECFKNRYSGERCFILGTGPSLNLVGLDHIKKLSNEFIFAVNFFYKVEKFKEIVPDFYALVDTKYRDVLSGEYRNVLNRYIDKKPIFITDYRAKKTLDDLGCSSNSIFIYGKNYPIKNMRYDLSKNSSITMNVVGSCIKAAMYMGFEEIYLLGCDYNAFCNLGIGHCYDDRKDLEALNQANYNLGFYLKYYYLTTEFHYLIKKKADEIGVSIINLTESSLLDAYPKRIINEII